MLKEFSLALQNCWAPLEDPLRRVYCVQWRWSRDTLVLPHKYKNHAPIKRNERFWRLSRCFSFIISFAYLLPQVLCLGLCSEWLFLVNAVPSLQANETYSIQLFCLYAECEALVVKANWSSRYQIFFSCSSLFFGSLKSEKSVGKKKGTSCKSCCFWCKSIFCQFFPVSCMCLTDKAVNTERKRSGWAFAPAVFLLIPRGLPLVEVLLFYSSLRRITFKSHQKFHFLAFFPPGPSRSLQLCISWAVDVTALHCVYFSYVGQLGTCIGARFAAWVPVLFLSA